MFNHLIVQHESSALVEHTQLATFPVLSLIVKAFGLDVTQDESCSYKPFGVKPGLIACL